MPTVSVIVPTYNRAHILPRAIRSILRQTYEDFEIIVIDDCSTDNTRSVIEEFKDGRIIYIRQERNKGVAAARNTGLALVKGKYVAFLDSDDEWLPDKLQKQWELFGNAPSDVGVVYSGICLAGDKMAVPVPAPRSLEPIYMWLQASLIKKVCFDRIGNFDESLATAEDLDLRIRILENYKYRCMDDPLTIIHETRGSLTADTSALAKTTLQVLEKNFGHIRKDPKLYAGMLARVGYLYISGGKTKEGRTYLFKAASVKPTELRYVIEAVVSLGGSGMFGMVEAGYRKFRDWQRIRAKN